MGEPHVRRLAIETTARTTDPSSLGAGQEPPRQACGKTSERTGGFQGKLRWGKQGTRYQAQYQKHDVKPGTARVTDVFKAQIGSIPKGVHQPAMFPIGLAENLIKTFSRSKDIVLDPFAGSGNIILAALRSDRDGIGIDIEAVYVELAQSRVKAFIPQVDNTIKAG